VLLLLVIHARLQDLAMVLQALGLVLFGRRCWLELDVSVADAEHVGSHYACCMLQFDIWYEQSRELLGTVEPRWMLESCLGCAMLARVLFNQVNMNVYGKRWPGNHTSSPWATPPALQTAFHLNTGNLQCCALDISSSDHTCN
jgi:hypothetical protein